MIESAYQDYLRERSGGEEDTFIFHFRTVEPGFDVLVCFDTFELVEEASKKVFGSIRRQKLVRGDNQNQKAVLLCEGFNSRNQIVFKLEGDVDKDCTDIVVSIQYSYQAGDEMIKKTRRMSPFHVTLAPHSNTWVFFKVEFTFCVPQIVGFPLHRDAIGMLYEFHSTSRYGIPRCIDNQEELPRKGRLREEALRIAQECSDEVLERIFSGARRFLVDAASIDDPSMLEHYLRYIAFI